MSDGLTNLERNKLNAVFSRYPNIEKAILYGSRAKGTHKPFSDVDITLIGNAFSHNEMGKLSMDIDDLLLPYQVDMSIFHTLANPDLIEHIKRIGITIYTKPN